MSLQQKTILWDFDGTLFDTYDMYTSLFQKFIKEQVTDEFVYNKLKVSFSHAANYFGLSDEEIKKIRELENQWPVDQIKPFPGVEDILKSAGKNVIMTHKSREPLLRILKAHKFERYFAEIVSGDDGYPRKPDPASYKYLHSRHQIDLVIGDRLLDIIPGKKLGIQTCLFQNKEEGADYYLNDYREFDTKVGRFLDK